MFECLKEGIVIAPTSLKNKILRYFTGKLFDIKIMSREEYIKKYTFDYDFKAIIYLMEKYHYNKSISKEIIDSMYYVDRLYDIEFLDNIYKLKEELLSNNLLYIDDSFKTYIKDKTITIIGYDKIDDYFLNMLPNYKIIDKKEINDSFKVYEFSTLDNELEFVASEISKLLDSGVKPSNIYVLNAGSEYDFSLNLIFSMFNLPIDKSESIYSSIEVNNYLSVLKETGDFNLALEQVKSSEIFDKLLNISNKYVGYDSDSIYELVSDDINKTSIITSYSDSINIGDIHDSYFTDSDYVFLLGFNQNILPRLYKDESYLSNRYKNILGLDDSNVLNKKEQNSIIHNLKAIKNLTISYKLKHMGTSYYPSNLIKTLNMEVINNYDSLISYSDSFSKYKLTTYLDNFIKYKEINSNLGSYLNTFSIPYLSYDNKYNGVDNNLLLERINNKLFLSYSSIDTYYKCPFRYYISNVLRLDKYNETFPIMVGNLYHKLLSLCFNDDFDFEYEWNNFLGDKELSNKDKLLLRKLKEELKIIIKQVNELKNDTGFNDLLLEHVIKIDKSKDIPVTFTGIIDKLMMSEVNDKTLFSVIDYKTGNPSPSLNNLIYGLDMQLPIYLYLVNKMNLNNPTFTGMYLQRIINSLPVRGEGSIEEQIYNNIKLVGYSSSDINRVERFDPTIENSNYIKSMKLKKDMTYASYVKSLNDVEVDNIISLVDKHIDNARDNILSGEFNISPKVIGDKELGCEFCHFKDICFKTNKDLVYLKEVKYNEFLGGDDNA